MQNTLLKKSVPHIVALLVFLLISIVYFNPVIIGDKQIKQSDVVNFKGGSKEIFDHREKYGEEPLWTNTMFCGMPAFQISVLYPNNLVQYVKSILTFGLPHPVYSVPLAMLCFYLLLLAFGVGQFVALPGGIAYGLSTYMFIIIEAGHNPKAVAIAFMPAVLAGMVYAYRKNMLLGAALTALSLSLEIYANHLQITYYLFYILFFYVLAEFFIAIRNKLLNRFIKTSVLLLAGSLIAVGTNTSNLWSTYEYSKHTTRGKTDLTINPDGSSNKNNTTSGLDRDYATAWSYGKAESFTMLIPNFKGGATEPIGKYEKALETIQDPQMRQAVASSWPSYFGDQPFTSGPVYLGAIVVFLFVLGMFVVEGIFKWAIFAVTVLSVLLAWGHNFMGLTNFFFDYVPGYNKFRAVAMTLVIAGFTVPLLAALALDKIIKEPQKFVNSENKNYWKKLLFSFALTGGFALLVYLSPSLFNSYLSAEESMTISGEISKNPNNQDQILQYVNTVESVRMEIVKSDAIRSFVFILLTLLVIYLYINKKIKNIHAIVAVSLLILFDLFSIDKRFLNDDNFEPKKDWNYNSFSSEGRPGVADNTIYADKDPNFRVLNLLKRPDQDAGNSYFHKSLGGYHGAKMKRYQELIDFHIGRSYLMLQQVLKNSPNDTLISVALMDQGVLNMLNTKYLIYNYQAPPIKNPFALGNAWFVENIKFVSSADSEVVSIGTVNLRKTAVIHEQNKSFTPSSLAADSARYVKLTSYKANDLLYECNSSTEGLIVFSEIYYPYGWNAYIDGNLVDHFGVNFVLRGLTVPKGKHIIEFKFEPRSYYTGEKISLLCSLLLFAGIGGAAVVAFKKRKSNMNE